MEKIIGVDYGDARTGVAISDELGWMAHPLETIQRKGRDEVVIDRLIQIIEQYKIKTVVYGYPLNMNGTVGPRGEKTELFVEALKAELEKKELAVNLIPRDERLTTVIASKAMTQNKVKTKNKKGLVDRIAAVEILQGYLDANK